MNLIGRDVYVRDEGYGTVGGCDGCLYLVDLDEGGTIWVTIDKIRIV